MPSHHYTGAMSASPITCHLEALGARVTLTTDSEDVMRALDARLGRFRSTQGGGVLVEARLASSPPRVSVDGSSFVLSPASALSQAISVVFRAIMDQIERFLVLHAAALERDGRALLVAGPSGSGKTTLTLALLERGFRLLSDDFSPLERTSGLVHPFLKAAGIRPGAAQALASAITGDAGSPPSRLLSAASLHPAQIATDAVRVAGAVLIMDPRTKAEAEAPYLFSVLSAGDPQTILGRLAAAPGIRHLGTRGAELLFEITPSLASAPFLDRLLEDHASEILEFGLVASLEHDLARTPQLEPLTASTAMILLAREIQNRRPGGKLLATVDGNPARLVTELATQIGPVPCSRLIPGSPRATAQLLDRAFERGESD